MGKKFASIFLIMSLVVSLLLTGCGTSNTAVKTDDKSPTGKVDLIKYNLLGGKPFAGKSIKLLTTAKGTTQFTAMENQSKEFTDLTGINVVWDYTPWGAYQEKFMTEATAGSGNYDLMAWIDAWGAGVKNYLLPLDDLIKRDGIDMADYPKGFVESVKIGTDKTLGMPFRGHGLVLYYNKEVFKKLGLTPPKTWDEMVETSKKIEQQTTMKGIALPYVVSNGQNLMVWYSLLWGNGGDLFDKDWNPIFNNQKGVDATQRYVDFLLKDKIISPNAKMMTEADAATEMQQGRTAMSITWSWYYDQFRDAKKSVPGVLNNVGIASIPMNPEQKDPITYSVNFGISIPKDSKNQEAAWEYMKFINSKEIEKKIVIDKSSPNILSVVTMHNSNLLDADVNKANDGLQKITYDVLKMSRMLPITPQWLEVQSALEVGMNKIASGAPTQSTLDEVAKGVKAIMERAGYYKK